MRITELAALLAFNEDDTNLPDWAVNEVASLEKKGYLSYDGKKYSISLLGKGMIEAVKSASDFMESKNELDQEAKRVFTSIKERYNSIIEGLKI